MAQYTKDPAPIVIDDGDLTVVASKDPAGGVLLLVEVDGEDVKPAGNWTAILSLEERQALGPILRKIVAWGLAQRGYTAV